MTQIETAQKGEITKEVSFISAEEDIDAEVLRSYVASGKVVIQVNKKRSSRIIGIGKDLMTKVNASIGTSTETGAALSSAYGADFICYVTPTEHLGLPFPEDVREGVIAARIAAHIGDMIKLKRLEKDKQMAKARRDMRWQGQFSLSIDPERAMEIKAKRGISDIGCTMCGRFCANEILSDMFKEAMKGSDKC